MTEQEITAQIEQLESLQFKFNPREAAAVVSKLQSEASILKAKIAEAEAEFDKRQELTDALTQQVLALRKLQLQRKSAEVEPTFVELFHDTSFKVGQKEIRSFLEAHRRDTEESIKKIVQALSPTKH